MSVHGRRRRAIDILSECEKKWPDRDGDGGRREEGEEGGAKMRRRRPKVRLKGRAVQKFHFLGAKVLFRGNITIELSFTADLDFKKAGP